jgi:sialidase-1
MKKILVAILLLAGQAFAAEPFLHQQDLFTVGDDPAYNIYHIPGVVVTAKGTILTWCEARKRPAGTSDWDDIRILLRRSTDDGQTWSEPVSIASVDGPMAKNPLALGLKSVDPNDITYNNPVLIADRNGTIHMVFCLEYMRAFYQRSEDDGQTWSKPTEITATLEKLKSSYPWAVLATGPNHSIQLRSGRLIVPVWLSTGTGGNAHRPSVTTTIYSDDGGATWHPGSIAVPNTEEWINPNETVAVELNDGRVMLNVRNESTRHRRLVTYSRDGANGWSKPEFDEALLEPICMAGLIRYAIADQNLLLFSNPHNLEREKGAVPGKSRDRKNLSIKASRDDGKTWFIHKSLEPGPSMYSDLAVSPTGTIFCFYGRGAKPGFAGTGLTLARFNLEWLLTP